MSETDPRAAFAANFRKVEDLVEFDTLILEIPILLLERVAEAQDRQRIQNHLIRVDKPLALLRNLRTNESIRPRFQTAYSQCVVLAVSYFTSAIRDVFVRQVCTALEARKPQALMKEALSFTVGDLLAAQASFSSFLVETLIAKKNISFQDLKSIARAFEQYAGVTVRRDVDANDVIAAQACRHAIVHNPGVVDDRLLHQLRDATPRRIQPVLTEGDALMFEPAEIRTIGASMLSYLNQAFTVT